MEGGGAVGFKDGEEGRGGDVGSRKVEGTLGFKDCGEGWSVGGAMGS